MLIVGGSPDKEDDFSGDAFSGKAGKELERMLKDAGYTPDDYTLTYALKCKTPGNRKPTTEEQKACNAYLLDEIHRLRPHSIVALGDVALRTLTGRAGLKGLRGTGVQLHKSWNYDLAAVWPTYPPSYVLYAPQARNVVVTDLRRVRDFGSEAETVPWTWHDGSPIVADTVAWDIETDYDYATKSGGDTITQCAFSMDDGRTVVSLEPGKLASQVQARTWVTHNGWSFDVPRLRGSGTMVPWGDDTLVLAYLEDESQPLNLEALSVKYLGVKGWKEAKDAPLGSDTFALYNARDSSYTLALHRVLCEKLGERKKLADRILLPAHRALLACTERGIFIDANAVSVARTHYERELANDTAEISGLSSGRVTNPASNQQIGNYLVDSGHSLSSTQTGQYATDSATLAGLNQTPAVKAIRSYRKNAKALNAFVNPYESILRAGGSRVHAEYGWRTNTGRSNARNLNVQQLSRDPMLRAFFGAPHGSVFTTVDYGAIEFRLAAFIAGEEGILKRYADNPEWDPHTWFAAHFYGIPEADVTRLQRQIAKSANFGLLYMAQWFTLQEYALKTAGLVLSREECIAIRGAWHKAFPGFRLWYKSTANFLYREGYIDSLTGRRRHFGDPRLLAGGKFLQALREAVNMQVQSLAADVALVALSGCHRAGLPINGFFHDAISFEGPVGTLDPRKVERFMIDYPKHVLKKQFGVDITVPLIVDFKEVYGTATA